TTTLARNDSPHSRLVPKLRNEVLYFESFRHTIADRNQRVFERFSRNRFNEAFDQPPQTQGNRTAQADRLAFNNDAVCLLFEAPIRIQAPQKAAVVADRFFHFGSGSGILHFSDSCRETAAG